MSDEVPSLTQAVRDKGLPKDLRPTEGKTYVKLSLKQPVKSHS